MEISVILLTMNHLEFLQRLPVYFLSYGLEYCLCFKLTDGQVSLKHSPTYLFFVASLLRLGRTGIGKPERVACRIEPVQRMSQLSGGNVRTWGRRD